MPSTNASDAFEDRTAQYGHTVRVYSSMRYGRGLSPAIQLISLIFGTFPIYGLKLPRLEASITVAMLHGLVAAVLMAQSPPMPDAVCIDLQGKSVVPLARTSPSAKATVLIFYILHCPISRKYTPEINRIFSDYSKKGVRFFLIHEDLEMSREEVAKEAKEFGLLPPILVDKWRTQMRRTGATMSPEAAVYDSNQRLRYLGRIDDRWITLGNQKPKPTTHDLRSAIDLALSGRPSMVRKTAAIGCVLPKD
jgi:hypothetical protein